jgi:amphi-Trp domain-containing protein
VLTSIDDLRHEPKEIDATAVHTDPLWQKGTNMDIFEISDKKKMTREEAADLLRTIADSLARQNALDLTRDGKKLHIKVPNEVTVEVEIEIESDESSLEIEINW